MQFPKIKGTFLGMPMIRTIKYLGLYWGYPNIWETTIYSNSYGFPNVVTLKLVHPVSGKPAA